MTNVSFEVVKIEKAQKAECYICYVKFHNNSWKTYNFIRKAYPVNNVSYDKQMIIDGCKVVFDSNTLELKSVTREYETAGQKKQSTAKQVGKGTSSKIKNEMEAKEIEVPEIVLPEPEEIHEVVEAVEAIEEGEVHHEQYDTIKACLMSNIPVYLAGPAGSGKNHTVEQIANEMGWNFYFSNSVQQEFKLTGFIDAGGCFHETEFYKACTDENECVFFLDEMDASIPEVLVLMNAAIANGYFEFPNGRVDFDHVHFVAAGNTVGSGADEMYTGRMVLDQATLDRFAIIEFDYSMKIEKSITKNNMELINFIHQLRDEAKSKGIRATFSYRCMTMVTKLEKTGMDLTMIIKIAVVKGLDIDTIKTLTPSGYTKYHNALRNVQMAA